MPLQLVNLYSIFYVSQLRKYVFDPSYVLEVEDLLVRVNLSIKVQNVG